MNMIERILIMDIMSIIHINKSKEWMTLLKLIMTLTLNMTQTVIIPQSFSKGKTMKVEVTDLK